MVSASKDSKGSLQLPKAATSATISSRRQSTLLTAIKQGESWQFYSIWYMKPLCGDIPWNLTLVGRFLLTLLTQIISEKKGFTRTCRYLQCISTVSCLPYCLTCRWRWSGQRPIVTGLAPTNLASRCGHRWFRGFCGCKFRTRISSSVNSTMNILYRYFWYMYVYIHKCTL